MRENLGLAAKHQALRSIALAAAIAVASATHAMATDRTWTGIDTTVGGATNTNVDDSALWGGTVPGTGDRAIITFSQDDGANLDIPNTLSTFAPDAIVFNGSNLSRSLTINKDLTLSSLSVAASGAGSFYASRLSISSTRSTTLTLSGSNPLDVTGLAGWRTINASTGSNFTIFNITGNSVTFKALNNATNADKNISSTNGIQGGGTEQASIAANPQMNFSTSAATITLETPNQRPDGTIGLGFTQLGLRSDQIWNYTADANGKNTSFIRMGYRKGTSGVTGPDMIRSLDGGRLDNLGNVNIVMDTGGVNIANNADATTQMRVVGGTYGSLLFLPERANSRNTFLRLSGNVTFSGNAVEPGFFFDNPNRGSATTTAYGLILRGGDGSLSNPFYSNKRLDLGGNALTVTNGLLLDDRTAAGVTTRANVQIDASSATMTIGGDLVINSNNQNATSSTLTQNVGIGGNATTVINLAGNYSTNVVSPTTTGFTQGLSGATINLVGGTTSTKTFEVAAWSGQTSYVTAYALGTVNVGTATTSAKVQLVNAFLNDDASITLGHDGDKTGEKLMVSNLKIGANSTLDVNAQVVNIGTLLTIDPTGRIDLNTGVVLSENQLVTTFVGAGDQTAAWNALASRVMDSDNSTMAFTATFSSGTTVWQAVTPSPEPASLSLLLLAGLGLRRRRGR